MGIPHLAVPLRLDGTGKFATNEQDSAEELASSVAVLLATPAGSRVEVPDYGVPRLEFNLPSEDDLAAAVVEWEPRVDVGIEILQVIVGQPATLAQIKASVVPHV